MTECSESEVTADGHDSDHAETFANLYDLSVDVSTWTNSQDSDSHQRRSDIIYAIFNNATIADSPYLDHLRTILRSGWDVNEILNMPDFNDKRIQRTALHEAARRELTEGVKMLLDAGAKCIMSDVLENPLTLALHNWDCSSDLIDLLLENGADPNHRGGGLSTPLQVSACEQQPLQIIDKLLKHGADPNDHVGRLEVVPLLNAIINCKYNSKATNIVQLLLEHGADPNVTSEDYRLYPLFAALNHIFDVFAVLFKTLLEFGADVNYNMDGIMPLLHSMMLKSKCGAIARRAGHPLFLQEQLDMFFEYGGNIHIEDGECRTVLEYAVRCSTHNNNIRWLIRHGADTSPMKFTLLKGRFYPDCRNSYFPLMLLQAGMRVPYGTHSELSRTKMAISTWLQDDTSGEEDIAKVIKSMWDRLEAAEEGELQRRQHNFSKSVSSQQVVDLQQFSDDSLHVYPEFLFRKITDRRQQWQNICDQIHQMLEFLSQTQSLQWHCRRCVRENLVSLQPSVVKNLPLPKTLKRYILCHEI